MSEINHILYIEKNGDDSNPEVELLGRSGFPATVVPSISEAVQLLRTSYVRAILIDLTVTINNDVGWRKSCLELVRKPEYIDIVKVVIDIDEAIIKKGFGKQIDVPLNIHFHCKDDPDRWNKLVEFLRKNLQ